MVQVFIIYKYVMGGLLNGHKRELNILSFVWYVQHFLDSK